MATSDITNENGIVHFYEWMTAILSVTKKIHYLKGWMAATRLVK